MDLIVDFLSCMWEYAKEQITREIGAVADLGTSLHIYYGLEVIHRSFSFVLYRFRGRMAYSTCRVGCKRLRDNAGSCYLGRTCPTILCERSELGGPFTYHYVRMFRS